jgi:nucleoside-diphosphate-sugar epimerase
VHVLVAGAGWLGTPLCRALAASGHRVTAVRRDPARAAALASPGVDPLALDLSVAGAAARLPGDLDAIVACQSASGDGVEPYRRAYVDATRTLLETARARGRPVALVYTGSTGVFGQRDGSEVDEGTPPAPASASAEVLVEAERLVLEASGAGIRSMVLRLSGLYGPGRTWPVERVRAGQMTLGPGDGTWLNLCHLDDAVASVVAALERGGAGRVYHASDAEPVRRRDLIAWVASRLGVTAARRPEGSPAPSLPDRRIHAGRTRAELGIVLRHPTYRDGLGI